MLVTALVSLAALSSASVALTALRARAIETDAPRIGELTDVGGFSLHALHVPANADASLPPIVFIHGASGNLRDQATAFLGPLEGRAELLFVDRPGHGYSQRGGPDTAYPDGQAAAVARLMEQRGIDRAIIVGHSFGGAIAASFGVLYPEKTAGLLFLAPASHPWPGGVDWYYRLASTPLVGPLFCHTVALHAGKARLDAATRTVFAPNPCPHDYVQHTAPALVLRPAAFRANATDVANLHGYVSRFAKRYREIKAPTVIVTGGSDAIVLEEIHARGLARDIEGSELVWIKGLGHKPDYLARDLAIAAIEKIAGHKRDLQAMARALEPELAKAGVAVPEGNSGPLDNQ
ncbi:MULTISPECIES: alpha/beta fold hydrolase [Alphaproteobacteria]|uniref:Esterase n=2 Tax=Alphaproteobacteria TaxID=28211 RepID=A0A512HKY0_9HYPH|nr:MULTISPECIES: alpha/beta hydrolase [Alphaproteobacteria]GEO86093.1 esterase [Ciceribacter naphthalenivorans]GLR22180.1 esterase [Ciceribacter naphthalenivorans]GLT05036.1 esterase [Sphingomonas psychrolutea]